MPDWLRLPDVVDLGYYLRSGLEIGILWLAIYALLRALERISAGGKIKGLALMLGLLVGLWLLARFFQLHAITWLIQAGIGFGALALVVVFQPELRKLAARMGAIFPQADARGGAQAALQIIDAVTYLAQRRIGALIVLERTDRLDDLVSSSPFDCELTAKALISVFWKNAPLHDGAVVLRGGRIAAAGVILPLTSNPEYASLSGTRHHPAIGVSEETDALALVVSEESGAISLADKGRLVRELSRQDLEILLGRVFRTGSLRTAAVRGSTEAR